jgi:nucleotide-binding universal stress UspA family protein
MTEMKIVVGVDGSEHSARAVKWCADHARALDAEVVAVHAVDMPLYSSPGASYVPLPPLSDEKRNELLDVVQRDWCKALADAGVTYRGVVLDGGPAWVLMEFARKTNADLIVTGRRGRGGFTELLLGSTSHALTHHADRPLVIVP